MALRTSSSTHVPTIHLSSSVCIHLPWVIVAAEAEHNGNISLELLLYGSTGWHSFLGGRTLNFIYHTYPNIQGDSLHSNTLSADVQGTCRI